MRKLTKTAEIAFANASPVENGQIIRNRISNPIKGWIYIFTEDRSIKSGSNIVSWWAMRGDDWNVQALCDRAKIRVI